jgi:hypothetical protein
MQWLIYIKRAGIKGGRAPAAYKARFPAWLSYDSYSEDI